MIDKALVICCPSCESSHIIHYGRTNKGTERFHCMDCNKTWSDYLKRECPSIVELVEEYLLGETYRQLQEKYHLSSHHLNERIRCFLSHLPNWECFIDLCVPKNRDSRLIHLFGLEFNCYDHEINDHKMYLALAVDAISTLVLGFEIGNIGSDDIWYYLLDRLNCRGIICPIFLSTSLPQIDDALKLIFPQSTQLTNYYRYVYDRDLQKRVKLTKETDRLLTEAFASYQNVIKPQFREYSFMFKEKNMRDILQLSRNYFVQRLETRITTRTLRRIEGLKEHFIERFKGFRILKDDPFPLVNGWIAQSMLQPLDFGFSRLSLYMQIPVNTFFKDFSENKLPEKMNFDERSDEMRKFVIEIAIRGLQISNFILPKEEAFW